MGILPSFFHEKKKYKRLTLVGLLITETCIIVRTIKVGQMADGDHTQQSIFSATDKL